MKNRYIAWFNEIDKEDIPVVGGKGANLGEMVQAGIPVPFGFVITSKAYFDFLEETDLTKQIKAQLQLMDHKNSKSLSETSRVIQTMILNRKFPEGLGKDIMHAYLEINARTAKGSSLVHKLVSGLKAPFVAVRSSATAEDLPGASFAGQQDTYLNVSGEVNLLKKVHQAWASLFTPRAIFYREENHFDHMKVGIAVVVQQMVNSDTSGVMFTLDPVTNEKSKIMVEAIFGLGEFIVQGEVTPDHYEVMKKSHEISAKKIAYQTKAMVRKGRENIVVHLDKNKGSRQKISDELVVKIAHLGEKLEKHYYFPQDIEWAVENGNVYIVQTRPVTTTGKNQSQDNTSLDTSKLQILVKGDPASPGIKSGPVKVIMSAAEIGKVYDGEVLVTKQTNPDFVPAMKRAVAIVTERGGRTSHAAIVSRELGIPAVVGTGNATSKLKTGEIVTVNGSKGEIYAGTVTPSSQKTTVSSAKGGEKLKTATKVYVNLATPGRANEVSQMNADGIGLLRAEFMIADIGTHPRKLIRDHKQHVFINKLAEDLTIFCKAFNPRPVVYRATDFKTNEYRNLIGGKDFEPEEPNPMLGYRGAFRYISDPEVFEMELEAIKLVREKQHLKNLWLMIPFLRNLHELSEVKKLIDKSHLSRSVDFKLWMMVEIPSNVILIDKFLEIGIDGVSIGSNDLTMLILGTDRDNTEVSPEFDERNPAVEWAIERVIKACHKKGVTSSICGQAPSDYPELVERMVHWGITSVSVNPDAIDKVRSNIHEIEKKLIHR